MTEVTDQMVAAFEGVWWSRPVISAHQGVDDRDRQAIRGGLAAALTVVERDRCLKPSGHVFHPLAHPAPKDPRAPHSHVCVSCSPDASAPGPGCVNCRQTGWDQTPCLEPGHLPHCPSGCCDQGGAIATSSAAGPG
jgi:hypothetical protein